MRAVERRKGDMILSGREDVGRPYISRLSIRSIVPLYSGSGNASVPSGMTGLVEDDPKSIISNEILTNRYRTSGNQATPNRYSRCLSARFFPVIPLIQHPICGEPRLGAGIDEHLVDGVHGVKVYDDVERRGVPAVLVLAPERGVILVRGVWVAVLEEDVPLGLVHHPAYRADGPVRVGEIIPELGDDVPFRQVDT